MKILQKLILPVLIIAVIFLIYKIYFAKTGELGSFSDFDPNNSANKEIRVHLLAERGIEQQGHTVSFYVADKNGNVVQVAGELVLPEGFEKSNVIILKGHLNQSGFHAHDVLLD
jgi:cytochrome c-type biogenesis protein CcmE